MRSPHADLMPAPAGLEWASGKLAVESSLTAAVSGQPDARLDHALMRLVRTWQQRTGFTFVSAPPPDSSSTVSGNPTASITVTCARSSPSLPVLGEDESYTLTVTPRQVLIQGVTTIGALRGIATLEQLLTYDEGGWFVPALTITDRPRFPWRGLLIDVARHWQPIEVIKRNLDGMALVKLNVLHLHLTDDQGFRVESKVYPQLQTLASDGNYFTQDQIREIIAYAAERGIRVVPEFDIPGHATSWVVAFPELASAPGPYAIERHWGVFNPVLDPTNERTYAVLDGFLGEMAALFADPYLHIGGDENNGAEWNANPRIQSFIREHGLKDNAGLHAYFNQRVRDILAKHGKKLIGWDEILHPGLPNDSIVQSWRGPEGLAAAARQGFATILSNGYYIDLCHSAADHYRNDPLPAGTALTTEEQHRVLGGEATMWSEWVTPETIDSRIWPRTAAIAERLWSPGDVIDIDDMYRRLELINRRLEEIGLEQDRNRPAMIRRLAGVAAGTRLIECLTMLVGLVEPVKDYTRAEQQPGATQFMPLTGIADCARPESDSARGFRDAVGRLLSQTPHPSATTAVRAALQEWSNAAADVTQHAATLSPNARAEAIPVALNVTTICIVGLDALDAIDRAELKPATWRDTALARLEASGKPHAAVEIPIVAMVRQLVDAAAAKATPVASSDPDK